MKRKLTCILFIDDDEPTNFLNKMTVEESCCTEHIQIARNGQEALDYLTNSGHFQTGNNNYPSPDLIFLDINMPGMDGWEFLERYQQLPASQQGNIVMVMLTTSLNPDDEETARKHPVVSGFEHKPLGQDALNRILQECFADHF